MLCKDGNNCQTYSHFNEFICVLEIHDKWIGRIKSVFFIAPHLQELTTGYVNVGQRSRVGQGNGAKSLHAFLQQVYVPSLSFLTLGSQMKSGLVLS